MKIIFMGTPDFAVSALDALCRSGQEVILAVTQPDRQKGRGRKVIQTPVKVCAEKWGVPVFQPVRIREAEAIEQIRSLSPDLIKFTFPYLGSDWIKDEKNSAKTEEREIYYYNKLLKAGEDTSATPLTGTLTIDQLVGLKVNKDIIEGEDGKKTIIVSYKYDGWKFCVEADVDAVQDHNAEDAIRSAWGRDVTISNGTLSLN